MYMTYTLVQPRCRALPGSSSIPSTETSIMVNPSSPQTHMHTTLSAPTLAPTPSNPSQSVTRPSHHTATPHHLHPAQAEHEHARVRHALPVQTPAPRRPSLQAPQNPRHACAQRGLERQGRENQGTDPPTL